MRTRGKANAVDAQIGSRIRLRREALGMSQTALGNELGISFQQVQKYEKGMNRVSAGQMKALAAALKAPVSFFFEGLNGPEEPQPAGASPSPSPAEIREARQLQRSFARISDPQVRRQVIELVKVLADLDQTETQPSRLASDDGARQD